MHLTLKTNGTDPRMRKMVGCLFAGGMIAAPFIALLFDVELGLAVMAIALGATAYLVWETARHANRDRRKRLNLVALLNGLLALTCLIALIVRSTS